MDALRSDGASGEGGDHIVELWQMMATWLLSGGEERLVKAAELKVI